MKSTGVLTLSKLCNSLLLNIAIVIATLISFPKVIFLLSL